MTRHCRTFVVAIDADDTVTVYRRSHGHELVATLDSDDVTGTTLRAALGAVEDGGV